MVCIKDIHLVIASPERAKQSSQAIAGAIAGDTMSGADYISARGHGTGLISLKPLLKCRPRSFLASLVRMTLLGRVHLPRRLSAGSLHRRSTCVPCTCRGLRRAGKTATPPSGSSTLPMAEHLRPLPTQWATITPIKTRPRRSGAFRHRRLNKCRST